MRRSTSGWDGCTNPAVIPSEARDLLSLLYFFAVCFVPVCLAAGFFAVLFDLERAAFAADGFVLALFDRDLALLDLDRLAFALLDLLPIRPALTEVCTRLWRERATRSGRFQPMARSARNLAGISSIPSP